MVMRLPVLETYPATARAMPKSDRTASPDSLRRMLFGLMSRWMIPVSWAKASARAMSRAVRDTSCSEGTGSASRRWASDQR